MKPEHWAMPLVFLAVALPLGLLLIWAFGAGPEVALIASVIAGGFAASVVQARLRGREQQR